ncbi:MAG TPA: hypothetical protein VK177_06230 [Flavobacteriales bacterium]|nr:hypothetical protein [Flavobacteriales bacterium]
MAFGKITQIQEDPQTGTMFGELKDLDTNTKYTFQKQANIPTITRQDVVNYTAQGAEAIDLTPNLAVKLRDMQTASPDVQLAAENLIKAMAKDKNMTDVVSKKL